MSNTKPNAYVHIEFDMTNPNFDFNKLHQIEKLFRELGITFDTGAGCGGRDWEWDWSLEGPVKVTLSNSNKIEDLEETIKYIKNLNKDT